MDKLYFRNENGHSLLEMTLVLLIIATVLTLPLVSLGAVADAGERNQFIYQLQQDLYYAQQMALSQQLVASVVFLNGSKEYIIRQGGEVILRRKFQVEETTIVQGTLSLTDISFLPNGNVQKSGSLTIRMNDHRYRLVLLLGKGRFYIEQL
jgi:competence protein ComGD